MHAILNCATTVDCNVQRAACNVFLLLIHLQQQFLRLTEREREREKVGAGGSGVTTHLTLWHVLFTFRIRSTANWKTNRTCKREADHVERVSIWFNNEWHLQQMDETLHRLRLTSPTTPQPLAVPSVCHPPPNWTALSFSSPPYPLSATATANQLSSMSSMGHSLGSVD